MFFIFSSSMRSLIKQTILGSTSKFLSCVCDLLIHTSSLSHSVYSVSYYVRLNIQAEAAYQGMWLLCRSCAPLQETV